MHLSYWEINSWFTNVDYTIVGSGITGLHAALRLREKFPQSKILVLERGPLPQGASTKNAGFACFGSLSEIIEDLKNHTEEEVIALIRKRWEGLQLLRKRLGDTPINFKPYGGYELFLQDDTAGYDECVRRMPFVNEILRPLFKADVFAKKEVNEPMPPEIDEEGLEMLAARNLGLDCGDHYTEEGSPDEKKNISMCGKGKVKRVSDKLLTLTITGGKVINLQKKTDADGGEWYYYVGFSKLFNSHIVEHVYFGGEESSRLAIHNVSGKRSYLFNYNSISPDSTMLLSADANMGVEAMNTGAHFTLYSLSKTGMTEKLQMDTYLGEINKKRKGWGVG
ncbi:MAG: FAD-binding oxidoreductase, partial [Pedobacter sp.]